jgi:hypothetical protein
MMAVSFAGLGYGVKLIRGSGKKPNPAVKLPGFVPTIQPIIISSSQTAEIIPVKNGKVNGKKAQDFLKIIHQQEKWLKGKVVE